ncbi:MAG TPA: tRNA-intron lyase [Thermoplasmata archaeon]|nr:tRNA-intron lyase [Thermoplasmata archaeon]
MSGVIAEDATVLVEDASEAGAVYGRGFFGTVGAPGLTLDRAESVYLAEMGRLAVTDRAGHALAWTEVMRRAVRAEPGFPVPYLVYRDLRQRGYVVRSNPPPARFAVLPRGGTLHKTPARFWVQPISERAPFDLSELQALFDRARAARKTLLLGVIDEESDLTYYRVAAPTPNGVRTPKMPADPVDALVNEDRVTIIDPAAVELLGHEGGFGSRIGARLELSFVEAAFLAERQALTLRHAGTHRTMGLSALERRASRLDPGFATRRAAYRWLRDRGLIVKTGFKYGAHFRAYVRDPEHTHARYLLQAVPEAHRSTWPVAAGQVRLAQGVRKQFLLAGVRTDGEVRCLELERIRP